MGGGLDGTSSLYIRFLMPVRGSYRSKAPRLGTTGVVSSRQPLIHVNRGWTSAVMFLSPDIARMSA